MKAMIKIELPQCCTVCPIMFSYLDKEANTYRRVCAYTKKYIVGEKERLPDCPLKPSLSEEELTYGEATYTDEEKKEIKEFVEGSIQHRSTVIDTFEAINKMIECLSKKADDVNYTLTLGIDIQENRISFDVMDWNEYKCKYTP